MINYTDVVDKADSFLGKHETLFSVCLALPNSWNSLYGISHVGSMYMKQKGKQYKTYATYRILEAMREYKIEPDINRRLFIVYNLYLNQSRFWHSDFDNRLKILNDSITASQLVSDDRLILGGLVLKRHAPTEKAKEQHIILQICSITHT